MELKWFSEIQSHGGMRYRLYKRNTKLGSWGQTPYFIDKAPNIAHYTMGKKYGLFGSRMGDLISTAQASYRIAGCFGGFSKLSEAKNKAKELLFNE